MTEEKNVEYYCEIVQTEQDHIELPAFGKIGELHAALAGPFKWMDRQCVVNGIGYTIKEAGFQSNHSGKVYLPSQIEAFPMHGLGMGIYLGTREIVVDNQKVMCAIIVTSAKMPHISNRCAECGRQLNVNEMKCGACESCYSMAVNL